MPPLTEPDSATFFNNRKLQMISLRQVLMQNSKAGGLFQFAGFLARCLVATSDCRTLWGLKNRFE
uniref:hypothetical protein n=1 Tax=Novipirellula sp. TaxID=2795430 RepID=UPI0035673B3C